MDEVTLQFWHGGQFVDGPPREYVGGELRKWPNEDVDKLDKWFIKDLAKSSGEYEEIECVYCLAIGKTLDDGLFLTESDDDIRKIAAHGVSGEGKIVFYVQHIGPRLTLLPIESVDGPIHAQSPHIKEKQVEFTEVPFHIYNTPRNTKRKKQATRKKVTPKKTKIKPAFISIPDCPPENPISPTAAHKTNDPLPNSHTNDWYLYGEYVDDTDDDDIEYVPISDETTSSDDQLEPEVVLDEDGVEVVIKDKGKRKVGEDSESAEQKEHGIDDELNGSDTDSSDEEYNVARRQLKEWFKRDSEKQAEVARKVIDENVIEPSSENAEPSRGFASDYEDSDASIHTPSGSDVDEEIKKKVRGVPDIHKNTNWDTFEWKAGIKFPNREAFRDAVTRYALFQGRNLRYHVSDKNRSQRLGVRCVKDCPFKIYASFHKQKARFYVKSVVNRHTCFRNMMKNEQMKSEWVAKQFLEMFKIRPHWPGNEIEIAIKQKLKLCVKRSFCYKVKYMAHKMLHGSMAEHYSKVGGYIATLQEKNPNSSFILQTTPSEDTDKPPLFKRFFCCFEGCQRGFVAGCRKVLCLDGCFLKTFLGGVLLAAIGRDANDQMYPVAWAVVEGENNESWEWFCEQLKATFGNTDGDGWCFVSDQQKGIINAIAKLFPNAEHRNCARHIYMNWKKNWKGDELKQAFWRAVKAYNMADFTDAMTHMKSISPEAAKAFLAKDPKTFCRAYMRTDTCCDVVVSNMAETFNGYIIEARSKHLLDMLEEIRVALMTRLSTKRTAMEKSEAVICPRVMAKLDKNREQVLYCTPYPSAEMEFQVVNNMETYVVDLNARTCTCRQYDLTGIPCCHAISAIFFLYDVPEKYVHQCYSRDSYLQCYSGKIGAMPSCRYWPVVDMPMQPPEMKIMPGRPKKNRIIPAHEDPKRPGRLSRHGRTMSCSVCGSTEHTKKICPMKDNPPCKPQKRPRGRPKKPTAANDISGTAANDMSSAHPARRGRGRPRKNKETRTSNVPSSDQMTISQSQVSIVVNPSQQKTQ